MRGENGLHVSLGLGQHHSAEQRAQDGERRAHAAVPERERVLGHALVQQEQRDVVDGAPLAHLVTRHVGADPRGTGRVDHVLEDLLELLQPRASVLTPDGGVGVASFGRPRIAAPAVVELVAALGVILEEHVAPGGEDDGPGGGEGVQHRQQLPRGPPVGQLHQVAETSGSRT